MGSVNIKAAITAPIPPGTKTPLTVSSPQSIRGSRLLGSLGNNLASDIDSIAATVNALHKNLQTAPTVSQILLTNAAGQVTAAFGPVTYQGVPYTNYLSEIHVGNPLMSRDPNQALFNANLDGSVTIGQNGWLDVHDPFDGNAAWIGTQFDTLVISGAVNNGAGAIRLQVTGHTLVTGNTATVRNMNLYNVPNAVGTWTVTNIDANHVDLQGTVWAGPYTVPATLPGGLTTYHPTIDRVLQVPAVTKPAGLIIVQTSVAHGYVVGDEVNFPALALIPLPAQYIVSAVPDATHFKLAGSGALTVGDFPANTTCLRYFAGVLAQNFAIGPSFISYNLRAFPDGSLQIKNASITLTSGSISLISGANKIVLDPTLPSIDLSSATTDILLDASLGSMTFTTTASLAKIVIDATVPSITMYDSGGTSAITINSSGAITAKTISQSSTTLFTGTATVRNSAGTGVSTFTFVNGICTAYAP